MKFILERVKIVNLIFLLMIGFMVYCLFANFVNYDNDLWFILATGRSILRNGITHFDTLSMHSDYYIVTQQWLTSIIYYLSMTKLGAAGFSVIVSLISIAGTIALYKYSKYLTKNSTISSLLTILYLYFFVKGFTTTRPQIITYLILTLELFLTDKFIDSKNKKYLYALPILSIFEINMHASMWFLQFCFIGVYLIEFIRDKKIRNSLIITLIVMFLAGFINPYGIDAILYVFKSYGIQIINDNIIEMKPMMISYMMGKLILLTLFLTLFVSSFYKKINIRYLLLLGGTTYLALSHYKSSPYYGIAFVITMSSLLKGVNLKEIYLNIVNKIKFNKIKNILVKLSKLEIKYLKLSFVAVIIILLVESYTVVIAEARLEHPLEMLVNKLDEDAPNKDVTVYTNYGDGGYLEWREFKPYLDPRGDIFIKKTNKKFDLLDEAFSLDKESNVIKFVNKYKFDYLVVNTSGDKVLYNYLKNDRSEDYTIIYKSYSGDNSVLFKRNK